MIKLAAVGYGARIGNFVKACLKKISPTVKVVGIVDPNEKYARSFIDPSDQNDVVFYSNLDEMVRKAKPDALMIGTRCNLHASYAIEANKYKIPIFLEKPVATNMEQALALEKAFENFQSEVVVSFPLRMTPFCKLMKEQIDNKTIGRPEHILGINYVPYGTVYWEDWYRNYQITQGLFLQKATHDFDYMMFIIGKTIVNIGAKMTVGHVFGGDKPEGLLCSKCDQADVCLESPLNRELNGSGNWKPDHLCVFGRDCGSPQTGMNEDSSSAVFEFEDGCHGVYTQVFYARRSAAARGATVSGYQGTLLFDWYKNEMKIIHHHKPYSDTIKMESGDEHFGGDIRLAKNFIDVIQGRKKSESPLIAGLQSVYTCLAAKESAMTNKFVKVRQVGSL